MILFNRLQRETNNSPANLRWLLTEKPNLSELCWDLDYQYREISRLLIKKKKKHTISPPPFYKKWDEYQKHWESVVAEAAKFEAKRFSKEAYEEFRREFEEELLADGRSPEEFYKEQEKTPEEYYQYIWDLLADEFGLDREERFDPLVDDPAVIMNELYDSLRDLVVNDYFDGLINNKHLEVWDFFLDTIGIDYSKIYNQRQSAPELFIPTHMLSRNITPIEELYNEAVRAYIFGLTEASVAMCRALMEHILKKYYHILGDDLNRIISKAEREHSYLKGLNLHQMRDLANKVLHDYENRAQDIEKAALDFLKTIRHLVTRIPSP
ncbi:MAG: hypothetical protein A2Y80_01115 [Deltaproteobacteria bacterium RBG_13_58_19]|nr:MAG: hypothetical protein A2Y80_01115 [Deltaproteobacteria bacterium RBG_13_58_19]